MLKSLEVPEFCRTKWEVSSGNFWPHALTTPGHVLVPGWQIECYLTQLSWGPGGPLGTGIDQGVFTIDICPAQSRQTWNHGYSLAQCKNILNNWLIATAFSHLGLTLGNSANPQLSAYIVKQYLPNNMNQLSPIQTILHLTAEEL